MSKEIDPKAHRALLRAAKKVMAGLNARIRHARDETPVFTGIAALHDAINRCERPSQRRSGEL